MAARSDEAGATITRGIRAYACMQEVLAGSMSRKHGQEARVGSAGGKRAQEAWAREVCSGNMRRKRGQEMQAESMSRKCV